MQGLVGRGTFLDLGVHAKRVTAGSLRSCALVGRARRMTTREGGQQQGFNYDDYIRCVLSPSTCTVS